MINRCNMLSGCVKPTYLVIFKGDDTNFPGNQEIEIVIDTEMDLTGLKAHFRFMDFTQDFNEIPENKKLNIVIPHDKTSAFPIGASDATLFLEDQSGKIRTVSNRIHVVVTNSVHEAYENEDTQSVTVTVKGTVTWDMIEDKPTIPPAVTIDPTLTQPGAAADAKATGDALRSGFTEWEYSGGTAGYRITEMYYSESSPDWIVTWVGPQSSGEVFVSGEPDDLSVNIDLSEFGGGVITATRHAFPPTKTSQLTNDGAPNGGGTPSATTAQIPDVTGKADKVAGATAGNLASLTETGNLADSGVKPSDFATKADLPYALVEPGKWEFSGVPSGVTVSSIYFDDGVDDWNMILSDEAVATVAGDGSELSLTFSDFSEGDYTITATRASLPGHLLDRAGNRVVVSGDTTLTLPAAVPGYLRDFLVRLEISGSTVPTITFAAPTGETITYETDGDEFPVPDEAGDWLYSFTESCVAHKFAVSLKKVNTVAQGGA